MEFELEGRDFIELCNLLKIMGLCESGGQAKQVIANSLVSVNDQIETRKTCKIYSGSVVCYNNETIRVIH